mgnify:CR=1 FL=1|jgi:multimeric flavodoxin WrbA
MILVLNGSPNSNSKSMTITNQLIADKKNVKLINAYDIELDSCDDCKFCTTNIGCVKSDDMDQIYQFLEETDSLIVSSPIYFGALSDKMMKIINRFQRYYGQKYDLEDLNFPTIKTIIFITTQGSEKSKMINGANLTMDIVSTLFEAKNIYSINSFQSDDFDPIKNEVIINKINEAKSML